MRRPVGRRCRTFHRRAWRLTISAPGNPGVIWCPECGAIRLANAPVGARWAYPGDQDKAEDAMVTWYRSLTPKDPRHEPC